MSEDQTSDESDVDEAGAEDESVPMNRAQRRAKGKKAGQPAQFGGKQKFSPKNASAHGPRLWANRRAG